MFGDFYFFLQALHMRKIRNKDKLILL